MTLLDSTHEGGIGDVHGGRKARREEAGGRKGWRVQLKEEKGGGKKQEDERGGGQKKKMERGGRKKPEEDRGGGKKKGKDEGGNKEQGKDKLHPPSQRLLGSGESSPTWRMPSCLCLQRRGRHRCPDCALL
jgi:hypothetical protein